MARTHTMTPARKAALKKAQAASARKRRGKGKGKLAAANRAIDAKRNSRRGKVIGSLISAAVYAGVAYRTNRNLKNMQRSMSRDFTNSSKRMDYSDGRKTRVEKGLKMSQKYVWTRPDVYRKRVKIWESR